MQTVGFFDAGFEVSVLADVRERGWGGVVGGADRGSETLVNQRVLEELPDEIGEGVSCGFGTSVNHRHCEADDHLRSECLGVFLLGLEEAVEEVVVFARTTLLHSLFESVLGQVHKCRRGACSRDEPVFEEQHFRSW